MVFNEGCKNKVDDSFTTRTLRGQAAIRLNDDSFNSRTLRGQAAIRLNDDSFTTRTLRGQAAMEYLMTYGLALFVIVIVLALLLSLIHI